MWYIIILLMVTFNFILAEQLGNWRWANDTAELTHDKEAHFVGSAGAYFFFRHKDYTQKESMLYTFYLGLTKECIDALKPTFFLSKAMASGRYFFATCLNNHF